MARIQTFSSDMGLEDEKKEAQEALNDTKDRFNEAMIEQEKEMQVLRAQLDAVHAKYSEKDKACRELKLNQHSVRESHFKSIAQLETMKEHGNFED